MKQAWVYIKFVVLLSIWVLLISFAILHPDRALLILKLWGFGMLIIGFVYGTVWLLVKMFKPSELQPDNGAKKLEIEPGKGHGFYEKIRVLDDKIDKALIESITEESIEYYKKIRSIQIDAPQK